MFFSNIKRILEVLTEEWETTTVLAPNTRDLQRIRLSLSPLLFIETNLTRMISPEEVASRHRDICVRPNSEWKSLIRSRRTGSSSSGGSYDGSRWSQNGTDPTSALAALKDDITTLWKDPGVQAVLKKRHVRLEETSGL
jgi:guanine nucleotide-binding protein subunit alpha